MSKRSEMLPLRRAVLVGALVGLAWSASGLVPILSVFGFWMSGVLLLLVTTPLALWYAIARQHAGPHAIALSAAFVVGLVPGAWRGAAGLKAFWGELLFPLAVGALLALTLAPLYVRVAKRVVLRRQFPSAI